MQYQVKDWAEHFEGSKSKHYNNKTSCQMPTKHGLGYRKLIRHKHGPALFGAWCALVQVLSKQPKPREGYLTDSGRVDGRPYNATDLALLTDIPANVFDVLLQVASSEDVAWLLPLQGYRGGSAVVVQGGIDSDLDLDSDINSTCSFGNERAIVEKLSKKKGGDVECPDDFLLFWRAYPRKVGKAAALREWKKAKGKPEIDAIIQSVNQQKQTDKWQEENGKFIVYPARWLKEGRWDDAITTEIEKPQYFAEG
jgi:hypothetical protein